MNGTMLRAIECTECCITTTLTLTLSYSLIENTIHMCPHCGQIHHIQNIEESEIVTPHNPICFSEGDKITIVLPSHKDEDYRVFARFIDHDNGVCTGRIRLKDAHTDFGVPFPFDSLSLKLQKQFMGDMGNILNLIPFITL